MIELVKFAVLLAMLAAALPVVAASAASSPLWRRIWLALLILSAFADPMMTIDFHNEARHNVRGWEVCWPDLIAPGLITAGLMRGILPRIGVVGWLWVLHLAILAAAAIAGTDGLFSAYYLARQLRALLVLAALAMAIEDRRDLTAAAAGIALALLWNGWAVLAQRHLAGRFQCPGLFDHQNAMSMAMSLAAPALLAVVVHGAAGRRLGLVLPLAVAAAGVAALYALSRAGLLVFAGCTLAVILGAFASGIDRRKLAWSAVALAGGLLLTALTLPGLAARFGDQVANDASQRTREVMNQAAAAMHADHPWLGVGPNNYASAINAEAYGDLVDESMREKGHRIDPGYRRGVVESHFWQMRAEAGWLGYGSFVALLAASLAVCAWTWLRCPDPLARAWALGVAIGLLGNYGQGLLEHTLVNNTNLYLWAILNAVVGRLCATVQTATPAATPPPLRSLPVRGTSPRPALFWV